MLDISSRFMKGSCANMITSIQDCSCWWPCFLYCHITSTVNIVYVRLVGLNVLQGKIFLPVMYVEISFKYPNNYNHHWKIMLSYKPANPFANCYNPLPQYMNNKAASMFLCLQFQRTIIGFSSLSLTFSMSAKFSSIANFLLGSDEYLVVLDVKL